MTRADALAAPAGERDLALDAFRGLAVAGMALVTGWKLPETEREALLRRFPPRWAITVADHVTLWARRYGERPLPTARDGLIVGRADDGRGVEAICQTATCEGRGMEMANSYHFGR